MKISSNFHDYYDSLRATDQDEDPFYVRITNRIEMPNTERFGQPQDPIIVQHLQESMPIRAAILHFPQRFYLGRNDYRGYGIPNWVNVRAIGFCGRVYPFISVGRGKEVKHAYNSTRALKLVQEYKPANDGISDYKLILEQFKRERDQMVAMMSAPFNPHYHYFQYAEWDNYVTNNLNNIGDNAFRHFRAPVLLFHYEEAVPVITVNPNLKPFDFVQVLSPPQAYQELSMYVGNNLAGLDRKEPRPITDDLKAHAHGFDKWSFKNQKNRKTANRSDWE